MCNNSTNYFHFWQFGSDLGIADHVRKVKCETMAQTVDSLGDQLLPAIRAGWPTYIRETYLDGEVDEGYAIGQGALVLDD